MVIISQQPVVESSPYVFPATRGQGHFTGSKRIWTKARIVAGLPGKVRYHARHAVATLSLAGGADVVSVSNLLGHANPRTTLMTYSHVTDKASEAAETIGNAIDAAMKQKPAASVIPLSETGIRK
jgi:integrase